VYTLTLQRVRQSGEYCLMHDNSNRPPRSRETERALYSVLTTSSALCNCVSTPGRKRNLESFRQRNPAPTPFAFDAFSLPRIPAGDRHSQDVSSGQFEIGSSPEPHPLVLMPTIVGEVVLLCKAGRTISAALWVCSLMRTRCGRERAEARAPR